MLRTATRRWLKTCIRAIPARESRHPACRISPVGQMMPDQFLVRLSSCLVACRKRTVCAFADSAVREKFLIWLRTVTLDSAHPAYVSATCEPWDHVEALPPDDAWKAEVQRRERLVTASDPALQTAATFLLPLAADQFVIDHAEILLRITIEID